LENANRACELDPLAWVPPSIVALIQLSRGDLAQSRVWLDRFEKVRGKVEGFQIRLELFYALAKYDTDLARRALAIARSSSAPEWSSPADKKLVEAMNHALASADISSEASAHLVGTLEEVQALGSTDITKEFAAVAVFVKQQAAALAALWFEMRSPGGLDPAWIWTPSFRPVRNDARFLELLRAIKLPEYWSVAGWGDFCQSKSGDDFECIGP
jgi:hypothetical protein